MASFQGTITSYGMKKGYGFIASEQIEGDVFFLRRSLPIEFADGFYPELDFQLKGNRVSFTVQRSRTGKSEAINIKFVPVPGKPVVGEVKTYNEAKGYGFLMSSSVIGQDLIFSRRDVPQMLQGMDLKGHKCAFIVSQKPDGKLQANDLKFQKVRPNQFALSGGSMGTMGMPGWGMIGLPGLGMMQMLGKGFGKGFGRGLGKGGFGKGGDKPEPGMQGTVISYNASKGYGFIKSGRVSSDIYFKAQGNFLPGMVVGFNLKMNRDDKPSALGVRPGLSSGQSCIGTVKGFFEGKGFGFLAVVDHPADVYFNKDSVPAQARNGLVGKRFRFTVQLGADGKARAENLEAC